MSRGFLLAAAARALDARPLETRETCCAKYRQIFVLRNRTDEDAVPELIALFQGTRSVLLRHEIAYALGQMQRLDATPFLAGILANDAENPITRHEAAEALGAIAAPESLDILKGHAADGASEVSDTCGLALALLNHKIAKGACGCERRPQEALQLDASLSAVSPAIDAEEACPIDQGAPAYTYVTPAPAAPAAPTSVLREQLLDTSSPLFERYRALFALRDATHGKEGASAMRALCDAFADDCALLKHEIAFVLGQLAEGGVGADLALPALCKAVRCETEHGMVRHEAAEALGALGTPEAVAVLSEYACHHEEILRESCWVALMWLE